MNQEPAKILFASDLTTEMKLVFEQAVTMATVMDASIVVLHVMEHGGKTADNLARMAFGETMYEEIRQEQKAGAKDLLTGKNVDAFRIRRAIAGAFQDSNGKDTGDDTPSPISKILVTESRSIADEIVMTAVQEGCKFIVMGCKKQGLIAEAMGENNVRKVLKRSDLPVYVVPFVED